MKPFLNINAIEDFEQHEHGPYREQYCRVSKQIGAQKLGYGIVILDPGFKVCPFHNHHIYEEMFLVLEGEGTLRFGKETYAITGGDIIACPPGGPDVAHQIINTGERPMKYLALSTLESSDVCEYPDSRKLLTWVGAEDGHAVRHISRIDDAVDYFDGEDGTPA